MYVYMSKTDGNGLFKSICPVVISAKRNKCTQMGMLNSVCQLYN
jgi:hypothetical protein